MLTERRSACGLWSEASRTLSSPLKPNSQPNSIPHARAIGASLGSRAALDTVAMLTNDAFRAMLSSHAEQPAHADATPEEPEEPEEPQRTAVELWAEAPTQPPVLFDRSHGLGLLSSCGCFDIAAEHVDPDCDLCAQNPHADLWAEYELARQYVCVHA